MTEARQIIISCDGHATGRPQDYIPYVDPNYRSRYEDFVREFQAKQSQQAAAKKQGESLFTDEGSFAFNEERGDDRDGEWNSSVRTRVLEEEGIVAEVLFPNGGVPFGGFGESAPHELRGVGNRAYDRWLVDFADAEPGRRAALAMLTVHDLDATCQEIRWAAEHGMKGVIIPTVPGEGLPPYYDPCYDPLWAACQDCALPVHIHGGGGTPDYGDYGVVSMLMYATEATFFSQRNLWVLIWGGVLERFPDLKVVFTETRAEWVPGSLALLDGIHGASFFQNISNTARLKPSEYFERQCYVAASSMSRHEAALRHEIGLGQLMWGADYPHVEGTWPGTQKSLRRCFKGLPIEDVETILSSNPATLYGFDVEPLQAIANQVGPTAADLVGAD